MNAKKAKLRRKQRESVFVNMVNWKVITSEAEFDEVFQNNNLLVMSKFDYNKMLEENFFK